MTSTSGRTEPRRCCRARRAWPSAATTTPSSGPRESRTRTSALMLEAGVDLVTVGVFSWALARARARGATTSAGSTTSSTGCRAPASAIDLATATASPPPVADHRHPEMLPQRADGTRLWPGGRQALLPELAGLPRARARAVPGARRAVRRHPALRLWHVGNELGCHNAHCYCDVSAEAFRVWLRRRYGDVDATQRGLGHRVLVPALHRLRRGAAAARGRRLPPTPPSSSTSAVLLRRAARQLRRRARRAARASRRGSRSPRTSW